MKSAEDSEVRKHEVLDKSYSQPRFANMLCAEERRCLNIRIHSTHFSSMAAKWRNGADKTKGDVCSVLALLPPPPFPLPMLPTLPAHLNSPQSRPHNPFLFILNATTQVSGTPLIFLNKLTPKTFLAAAMSQAGATHSTPHLFNSVSSSRYPYIDISIDALTMNINCTVRTISNQAQISCLIS